MRHVACHNDECPNEYAPFFDFEPAEVIVPCPVCGTAMTVTTLEDAAAKGAAKNARLEAEAVAAAEAELAANPPVALPPAPPTLEDKLAAALEAIPDGPIEKTDLADVIAALQAG